MFAALAVPAQAQNYPSAPIRIISGFPAGTTADISARVVGAKMGQILGQQSWSRTGSARRRASRRAGRARRKDGYTLFVAPPPT